MFLDTGEAAKYLAEKGVPFKSSTLVVWRCKKRGPEFKRIMGRVFYEKAALDDFIEGRPSEVQHAD